MPEPFKKEFMIDDKPFTSVVMDQQDFDDLCDEIGRQQVQVAELSSRQRLTPQMLEAIKQSKHIPMVGRGALTEWMFAKFNVTTDLVSFIVRGQGPALMMQLMAQNKQIPQFIEEAGEFFQEQARMQIERN